MHRASALSSPTGQPLFTPSSIVPFAIGSVDDGATGLHPFPENTDAFSIVLDSRTAQSLVPTLDLLHLQNPTLFLTDAIKNQTIKSTEVFIIATDLTQKQPPPPSAPDVGGGTANTANLIGTAHGPNARATRMSAIFWVEDIVDHDGHHLFHQLQYTQRVILDFGPFSWPHVSVATLKEV